VRLGNSWRPVGLGELERSGYLELAPRIAMSVSITGRPVSKHEINLRNCKGWSHVHPRSLQLPSHPHRDYPLRIHRTDCHCIGHTDPVLKPFFVEAGCCLISLNRRPKCGRERMELRGSRQGQAQLGYSSVWFQ